MYQNCTAFRDSRVSPPNFSRGPHESRRQGSPSRDCFRLGLFLQTCRLLGDSRILGSDGSMVSMVSFMKEGPMLSKACTLFGPLVRSPLCDMEGVRRIMFARSVFVRRFVHRRASVVFSTGSGVGINSYYV